MQAWKEHLLGRYVYVDLSSDWRVCSLPIFGLVVMLRMLLIAVAFANENCRKRPCQVPAASSGVVGFIRQSRAGIDPNSQFLFT